jgi:hypothetical protein
VKQTIAESRIEEMAEQGYRLVGRTSGTFSLRKGSNLSRKLEDLKLSPDNVVIRSGARAGKNLTEGYELLIFSKEEK